jgi:hypothetical protein
MYNSRITVQFLHYDMFRPLFLAIIKCYNQFQHDISVLQEEDLMMAKNSDQNIIVLELYIL